jgi:hypothetical protein
MTEKQKLEVERRIDDYFYLSEKILLRTLLFACFVYEASRFIWAMLK